MRLSNKVTGKELKGMLGKANSRWVLYLLAVLAMYFSLSHLAHCIQVFYESSLAMHLRRWLDAFLLAYPLWWMRKRTWVSAWFGLVCIYLLTIIWYFRTYATIMPLSSYLMIENTDGLANYVVGSLSWQDLGIVCPVFFFVLFYVWKGWQWGKPISFSFKAGVCLILIGLISLPYWPNSRPAWMQPFSMFNIVGPRAFKEFGLVNFWIYQISQMRPVSSAEKKLADTFVKHLNWQGVELPASKQPNLILILVESLQSWAVGLRHQGVEVTPVMNELVRHPHTVYFPHVVSQVKDGRSSDAQLIINTGLLPLNTRAAASLFADNVFPSLASELARRGYESASFICDEKDFWNQGRTTVAYGFHRLFDKLQQDGDKRVADSLLFAATLPRLKELKQPFYAQVVTYSTHMPYDKVQQPGSALMQGKFPSEEVRNYLVAVQLFDKRLGAFLDALKKQNMYDQSIIVLVGDHEQVPYHLYEGRAECQAADCTVPFMILNCPLTSLHTEEVVGQVDIYPTLLQVMGVTDALFPGLGENLFGDYVSGVAHYRTGQEAVRQGKVVADSVKDYRKQLWKVSDILLRMNYFAE